MHYITITLHTSFYLLVISTTVSEVEVVCSNSKSQQIHMQSGELRREGNETTTMQLKKKKKILKSYLPCL